VGGARWGKGVGGARWGQRTVAVAQGGADGRSVVAEHVLPLRRRHASYLPPEAARLTTATPLCSEVQNEEQTEE
jgi:hypothetical protein